MSFFNDEFSGRISTKVMQTALAIRSVYITIGDIFVFIFIYFLTMVIIIGSYSAILLFPFLSFISCTCFGRFIGTSGACFLSTSAIFMSFFLSLFALYETAFFGSCCNIFIIPWGVQAIKDGFPSKRFPALIGWKPSTSLSELTEFNISDSLIWLGNGSWISIPLIFLSLFNLSIKHS